MDIQASESVNSDTIDFSKPILLISPLENKQDDIKKIKKFLEKGELSITVIGGSTYKETLGIKDSKIEHSPSFIENTNKCYPTVIIDSDVLETYFSTKEGMQKIVNFQCNTFIHYYKATNSLKIFKKETVNKILNTYILG